MPKSYRNTGEKNLISSNLIALLIGYDIDKNVITRIETNKRYVTDIELQAFCEVLGVTYDELINGKQS